MRTLLLPFLLATATLVSAQDQHNRKCGAHSYTKQYLEAQGLPTDLLHALPAVGQAQRGGTYTIPVVVHVVWNTSAENVPTATIQAIINELNQDYSATNPDISGVRPQFTSSVANVGFNFCLAQIDPNGLATTGITRTQTTETWFDPDTETNAMKSAPLGKAPWDTNRYLNIWICDISSGATGGFITVGYAYLPTGGIVGSNIDGLVIDYSYGTQPGDRTATHEIGHYFGILHPFDEEGNCVNSDGFTDTPTSNSPTYSCANTSLMKCGVLTQYENFMDYASCSRMFTNQQANYMAGIVTGVRNELLTNNACAITPSGYCIPTSVNGTLDGDFINGVQLGSINNQNSGGTTAPTYTNYTATQSTSLARGTTYTINITGGTYQPDAYAAWIDYDQDQLFETSEKLGEFNTTAVGQTQGITFTVPGTATVGTTRLRVRGVYLNNGEPTPADPCYNYGYGETEDYGITITSPMTGPCIPTSTNGTADGDYVDLVALGTIVNQSGGVGVPTYTDFSATFSTNLERSGLYGVIIGGGSFAPDSYAAWIDYDQDDVFEASEKLGEFATTAADQSTTITFTVPAGAMLGATTMRVRGVYQGTGEPTPVDPCFAYSYGETEDYGIVITAPVPGYCTPTALVGTSEGDYINGVQLAAISNPNSGGLEAPPYSNFTSIHSTTLGRGTQQTLTIQGGPFAPDSYAAWIDYDNDQTFELNEKLGEVASTVANQTITMVFTVPGNASLGTTRMRVRGVYMNAGEPTPVNPCYAYAFGETEDYGILIDTSTDIDRNDQPEVRMFPNPTSGNVSIVLPTNSLSNVVVVDLQGRSVKTMSGNSQRLDLDLTDLAEGIYLVRIQHGDVIATQRLELLRTAH